MEETVEDYEDPIIKSGFSDLKAAILTGRTDIVRTILSAAQSYRDEDELFDDSEALENKHTEELEKEEEILDLLQLLLNFTDHNAGTPLHYATKLERADMVRTLLSAGANPTIKNVDGSTPFDYCKSESVMNAYVGELMQAAARSKMFRLKQLVSAGVSIDSGDGADSNNKVLHWAVSFGSLEMVKLVLDKGADINAQNGDGATPLFDAIARGDEQILAELLRRGADKTISPFKGPLEGKTPFELMLDKPWLKKIFLTNGMINDESHDSSSWTSDDNHLSEMNMRAELQSRVAGKDEEIILLSNEYSPEDISTSKKFSHGRKEECSSSILPAPLFSPVRPYFPTIVKIDSDFSLLWPRPQKISQFKGAYYVPPFSLNVILISTERFKPGAEGLLHTMKTWKMLEPHFKTMGFDLNIEMHTIGSEYSFQKGAIYCSLDPFVFARNGEYRVNFTTEKVNIIAMDSVGMYHAILTFLQCIRIYQGRGIPLFQIHDWPSFGLRGVILDFNDLFIPKPLMLRYMLDTLSQFKLCQVYFPVHLFLRLGENVPVYSRRDLITLLEFCSERHIDVAPLVKISSALQRSDTIRFLELDVFCVFPTSRYIIFDIEEENNANSDKGVETTLDLWSLFLDLHQTCLSNGRAVIIEADIVFQFPQRLARIPHGLVCLVHYQVNSMEHYYERLNDLGLPFIVSPQLWTPSRKSLAPHILHGQVVINAASKYDPLGVLLKYKVNNSHLSSLTLATTILGYSLGHAWKSLDIESTDHTVIAGIINRHILRDKNDELGQGLLALLTVDRTSEEINSNSYLDLLDFSTFRDIIEGSKPIRLSAVNTTELQNSIILYKRFAAITKVVELQCPEKYFIQREIFVIWNILLFLARWLKSLVMTCKDNGLSISNLTVMQKSDFSNNLLNLLEEYRCYFKDNFLHEEGTSPSAIDFLEGILKTLHPPSNKPINLGKEFKKV